MINFQTEIFGWVSFYSRRGKTGRLSVAICESLTEQTLRDQDWVAAVVDKSIPKILVTTKFQIPDLL